MFISCLDSSTSDQHSRIKKMVTLVKFVVLTAVLCCSLTPITATFWGDWGRVENCPQGERAIGFQLKTEPDQRDGDDTALNAIAFICSGESKIRSTEGPWGNWGSEIRCPSKSWLTSCQLRVESQQGREDDTSANNLNCKCSNGETLRGDGANWGDWRDWSTSCDNGIVAIQTRVERNQGGGDDTALNDVSFTCKNQPKMQEALE